MSTVEALPPTRRRGRGRPPSISREQIVGAALRLGLDTLSMQALARDLGVTAPALYSHVTGRDELVELVSDAARSRLGTISSATTSWRAWLSNFARVVHLELAPSSGTLLDGLRLERPSPSLNPQGRATLITAGLRPVRADGALWLTTRVALTAGSRTSLTADLAVLLDGIAAQLPPLSRSDHP